jgi:hypothetical protein
MAATMLKAPRRFTARNCLAEISCSCEVIERLKAYLRRLIKWKSVVGGKSTQMKPFQPKEAISKLSPNLGVSFLSENRSYLIDANLKCLLDVRDVSAKFISDLHTTQIFKFSRAICTICNIIYKTWEKIAHLTFPDQFSI